MSGRDQALPADHDWGIGDLMEPGGRGRAHAAWRFQGNDSARQALADLETSLQALRHEGQKEPTTTAAPDGDPSPARRRPGQRGYEEAVRRGLIGDGAS